MQRIALRVAALLLLSGAVACAWIWNARRGLPYEAGNFFDADTGVVLHEQSVTVYGLLALSLALIAGVCWLITGRG